MKRQIGWFTLKEDKLFFNDFECAAWYEEVLVKAGRYPVVVYDFSVLKHESQKYNNRVEGHIGGTYTTMPGTIVSDYFESRFYGMPFGKDYDTKQNVGKPARHNMFAYMYEIAESVLTNKDSPWELLPEFEAKQTEGEWQGEKHIYHNIYLRTASNNTKQ